MLYYTEDGTKCMLCFTEEGGKMNVVLNTGVPLKMILNIQVVLH